MNEDEILTIREVAALLKIGEKTTCTMAQSGQLPGFKVRGQWRFLVPHGEEHDGGNDRAIAARHAGISPQWPSASSWPEIKIPIFLFLSFGKAE
jgi:excisionase family DNA binding protein